MAAYIYTVDSDYKKDVKSYQIDGEFLVYPEYLPRNGKTVKVRIPLSRIVQITEVD